MSIFDTFKNYFTIEKTIIVKEVEPAGNIIAPVFRDIPPESGQGKFLKEGLRSWAYIAISAIADEISTTPIHLFKRSAGNKWVEVEENQVLNLLLKPNPFQTKEEFLWLVSVFLLAEGEAPIYIDNAKNPTSMVLLNPENITIEYDSNDFVGKYKYRKSNGSTQEIDKELIIFMKLPNWQTPFRGLGVSKYVAQTLDIDNFIEEYLKMFFYNDTTPGAVLETSQTLNKPIIDRLRSQFEFRHRGIKKSHKLAVLEAGLKYVKTTSGLNELQFKELNDAIRDKVLASFKVPKSVLGITEDVNRANGENSDRVFARRAVKPKLSMLEGQINQNLIPKFSENKNLWVEFENPVQDDEEQKARIWKMAIEGGWLTADEVRNKIGLEPLNGESKGKEHKNTLKINQIKGLLSEPKKELRKEEKKNDIFVEVIRDMLKKDNETKKEFSEEEVEKYHEEKIQFSDKIEQEFRSKLEANFESIGKEMIKKLNRKTVNDVGIDEETEAEIYAELSFPQLEEAIKKQGKLTYSLMGMDNEFDFDKEARNFLTKRTLKVGKSTAETTRLDLENLLKNWAGEKETIAELKKRLKEYFGGKSAKARAEAIARTEVSRSSGYATTTVYKRVGVDRKKWITARDERVCEFCQEMDGKSVPVNDNFWNKNDTMTGSEGGTLSFEFESISTYPLHVNCRCDLIPVFEN